MMHIHTTKTYVVLSLFGPKFPFNLNIGLFKSIWIELETNFAPLFEVKNWDTITQIFFEILANPCAGQFINYVMLLGGNYYFCCTV